MDMGIACWQERVRTVVEQVVKGLVDRMAVLGLIRQDQEQAYVYVIQLALEKTISVGILLVLGICYRVLVPTMLFLLALFAVKRRSGGFHARSYAGCLAGTLVVYILFVKCLAGILADHMQMTCILFLLSALTAGIIGAVNHPNMNWDSREYAGSKRIARLTILAETVVVAFMVVLGADRTATVFIMFAMILSAFLLVLAKIFGQEAEGT
mgnify:CR=1 FL=1